MPPGNRQQYNTKYTMAKESVKARQRKREHLVAQHAEKRAALKAAGDYAALDKNLNAKANSKKANTFLTVSNQPPDLGKL